MNDRDDMNDQNKRRGEERWNILFGFLQLYYYSSLFSVYFLCYFAYSNNIRESETEGGKKRERNGTWERGGGERRERR